MSKLNFIGCESSFKDSDTVIVGAPFDGTTSFRPGTRFAPNIIRLDSDGIETYSPYQDDDLEQYNIHDFGDVEVTSGNKDQFLKSLYETTKNVYQNQKKPLVIGGEHLISYAPIKACFETYPNLKVIHFDAHTDLREELSGERFSHATVMKRVSELIGPNRIYQFGIRSGLKEEFEYAKQHQYIEPFTLNTVPSIVSELQDTPVYITLDLDVLDPSVMSGTGTPEPGGVSFKELHDSLLLLKKCNIVGADIVELSPHYDQSGASTAVAVKLVRELLLIMQ